MKPFMGIPIGWRSVSMSVRGSMPDTDRGKDRRLPAAAGKWSSAAPNGAAAALTERAQILHPIVGRVAIQVRRCEHDARHPKPSRLHKIGPSGSAPSAVPPDRCFFVLAA
jgi:hypothetical protein